MTGIIYLAGGERPRALTAGVGPWPWLTGTSLAGPALGAAAVACTVAAAPWLARPWRRAAWVTLWLAAAVRRITAMASPMEADLAFAAGAGVLVLFGVPDRRIGPAGLPVARVEPAAVAAKGSRPFTAATEDGRRLFIKVLGSDQRDADLVYRGYRFIRLRDVGDTRPAASLIQAAEHQALVAVKAERAGVAVPAVRQVVKTADGSAVLVMDRVDGSYLQKAGVGASAGVAAVGVNSLAGAVVHLVLMVVFFAWSGRALGQVFKLPPTSKLLAILAVILAVIGLVLAARPGRQFAAGALPPGVRLAAASLGRVARNPGKMTMLPGGSALITLAYLGAFAASVQAFGGGAGFVVLGAVYLAAAAVAAAPTPGGPGALEAALDAGLAGVGMAAGPAVSAVLLTGWPPTGSRWHPGWLCWRVLQRREYV